eukprot:SM000284S10663  [mRNA]  locus=s284:60220:61911:+ [translate_table: standard]
MARKLSMNPSSAPGWACRRRPRAAKPSRTSSHGLRQPGRRRPSAVAACFSPRPLMCRDAGAYSALLYLAAMFVRHSCSGPGSFGAAAGCRHRSGRATAALHQLADAAAPVAEAAAAVQARLFSGDPATTLWVAPVLWVAAQLGAAVSLHTFAWAALVGMFTLPALYEAHCNSITAHGRRAASALLATWQACAHKWAAAAVGGLFAWICCSASTRLFAVFLAIVSLRCYQQAYPSQVEAGVALVKRQARRMSLVEDLSKRLSHWPLEAAA